MTLIELLVATMLMGIVMLGIVSVDFAVRRMQKNVSKDTFVTMRTSATLLDISKNAAAMTGDQNNSGFNNGVSSRFCFREDINSSGVSNLTPDSYGDDNWICYQQSVTSILKCNSGSSPANCLPGSFIVGTAVAGGLSVSFVPDNAQTVQNSSIAISIQNRFSPSQPVSIPDNPEVNISTQVSPTLQSF